MRSPPVSTGYPARRRPTASSEYTVARSSSAISTSSNHTGSPCRSPPAAFRSSRSTTARRSTASRFRHRPTTFSPAGTTSWTMRTSCSVSRPNGSTSVAAAPVRHWRSVWPSDCVTTAGRYPPQWSARTACSTRSSRHSATTSSRRWHLRASGEELGRQLHAAGVLTKVESEPGTTHGHLNEAMDEVATRSVDRIAAWITSQPA